MFYYSRHVGDYVKDCHQLSLLEHGAYTVLLDWAYQSEEALPEQTDEIYRLCKARTASEKKAVSYVLNKFFPMVDGRRWNKRAVREIEAYHNNIENKRNAGAMRWKKHRQAGAEQVQSESIANQQPLSGNHKPDNPADQGFAEIPSFAEMKAFAELYAGEPASGTPRIDQRWVPSVLLKLEARREPPRDWRRWVVSVWRAEWRDFQKKAAAMPQKQTASGRERGEILQALEFAQKNGATAQEIELLREELKACD